MRKLIDPDIDLCFLILQLIFDGIDMIAVQNILDLF